MIDSWRHLFTAPYLTGIILVVAVDFLYCLVCLREILLHKKIKTWKKFRVVSRPPCPRLAARLVQCSAVQCNVIQYKRAHLVLDTCILYEELVIGFALGTSHWCEFHAGMIASSICDDHIFLQFQQLGVQTDRTIVKRTVKQRVWNFEIKLSHRVILCCETVFSQLPCQKTFWMQSNI